MERTRLDSRILSNRTDRGARLPPRARTARLALCALSVLGALAALGLPATLTAQTAPAPAPGKPGAQPVAKPLTPPPPAPSAAELAGPPAGAARLPSGISTRLLRAGKGTVSPRSQDWVFFFAIGRRPDGTIVQNSYATPEPSRLQLFKLIPAWQEALAGMVVGEQRRFWFPAALAPKNPSTGAQEAVVFDLELVHVARMGDAPAALKAPDPAARQVGLGSWIQTMREGKAGPKATRQDAALLNFTVWNDLGQALSSTTVEGRPTLFPLDRVMTSFADCVEGMAVGEVRRCWISAARNEGFPGAPTGALIFELELLNLADAAKIFTPGTPKPN
jgi:FKBP-type peptidyl-prolyl cis-trans isomerase